MEGAGQGERGEHGPPEPLLRPEAQQLLDNTRELDCKSPPTHYPPTVPTRCWA